MKTIRWVSHLAVLVLLLGPCDESLPPYTEPEKFLQGDITALYVLGGNKVSTYFTITNIYEETLDDTVRIHGTFEIRSARLPHIKKTIPFSSANFHSGTHQYDPQTRRLTIDPGGSITFSVPWDFSQDDSGADPRNELFKFYEDPSCPGRCRAEREDLILTGEIYIFSDRAPVRASEVFSICYIYPYIGPPACISILTDPPCIEPPDISSSRCYPFGLPN